MSKSKKNAAFIIFALIFCLFSAKVRAQEEEGTGGYYIEKPQVFFGGLVLGANFSQVDGDYYAGYHKVGLNVGAIAYAQIKIT